MRDLDAEFDLKKVEEDRKNEEFSLNEININNKREINRGILDYFSFFERYLESKPFKLYEPKIPNLKILYNYLHHSRAQFLAINEFPGVFINNTRAFSSDNNPWEELGSADGTGTLSTDSLEVSVAELSLVNSISIGGTSTNSETSSNVTDFTHKLPVVINGETYSLLLKQ